MNKTEMKAEIFEVMFKAAVKDNFQRELQQLPKEEELPEDYEPSLQARKKIEKVIKDANHHFIMLRIQKAAKRVAVIAALIIPISVGSLLSVEASRNAIFNALIDWKSDHAYIHYQNEDASSNGNSSESGNLMLSPGYLPKGFLKMQSVKVGSKIETEYRNDQGEKIILDQVPLSEEGTIAIDTEHTIQKEIEIQGEEASLFTANSTDGKSYLVWKSNSYSFLLSSKIPTEQLIKIAESINE